MSENSETLKGSVKWFNNAKGFGFIEHTTGEDVFVHYSVIEAEGFKTLKDGEEVVYELKEGPKGLHAARVQRVDEAGAEGSSSESEKSDESVSPEVAASEETETKEANLEIDS